MEIVATLRGHSDRVWSVSWSPCGNILASCGADKAVRLWEKGDEWTCVASLEDTHSRTIRCVTFSPCGGWLAAASFDATTAIWRKTSHGEWILLSTLEGHENEVKCVAIRHGLIATCSRDKSIWLYEAPEDVEKIPEDEEIEIECISVLNGHTQDVKAVRWHPTEPLLFSASYDDTVRVWAEQVDDWGCVAVLSGHTNTVWDLATDPVMDRLATCSQDKSIRFWEVNQGKWSCTQTLPEVHERTIFSIDWSADGKFIVSGGGDDAIVLIQADTGSISHKQINAHSADINCVRWNPVYANIFASAGDDESVKIWKLV